MIFAAVGHHFAFSYKPFINKEARQIPFCQSFFQSLDVRDVAKDVASHAKEIAGGEFVFVSIESLYFSWLINQSTEKLRQATMKNDDWRLFLGTEKKGSNDEKNGRDGKRNPAMTPDEPGEDNHKWQRKCSACVKIAFVLLFLH